jgi:hypothetical protein
MKYVITSEDTYHFRRSKSTMSHFIDSARLVDSQRLSFEFKRSGHFASGRKQMAVVNVPVSLKFAMKAN